MIKILLTCVSLLIGMTVSSNALITKENAAVTFYWSDEDGGKYGCDHNRLQEGDAAVDFRYIPKGTSFTIEGPDGDRLDLTANDCGGRDVISRKAAHERGFHALVVDVWVPSESAAERLEHKFRGLSHIHFAEEHPIKKTVVVFPAYTSKAGFASYSKHAPVSPEFSPFRREDILLADD